MGRTTRLAAAAAALALPAAGSAPAQAATRCVPRGSTTLVSTSAVRAYELRGTAYACIRATGVRRRLAGAVPHQDAIALGGGWAAWTSGADHSVVHVLRLADSHRAPGFPYGVNDRVPRLVVKASGAVAWVGVPSGGGGDPYVQGTDRRNHSPDLLSDDTRAVVPGSLVSARGHRITWRYTTGPAGKADLY